MKKDDAVEKKLDEIKEILKRIEAKPQPVSYYPPIYVYPQIPSTYYPFYPNQPHWWGTTCVGAVSQNTTACNVNGTSGTSLWSYA
jgi:hypothetical protein